MAEMANEASAEEFRLQGNSAFRKGAFDEALKLYTAAIDLCSNDSDNNVQLHVLHGNRSAAWFKLKHYEKALQDAQAALAIDPLYAKAMFRGAQAMINMPSGSADKNLTVAVTWLRKVQDVEPANKEVDNLLQQALSQVASQAGAAAPNTVPTRPPTQRNTLDMTLIPAPLRQGAVYLPSLDGVSESLLLMLHGLGDTPTPYVKLAQKLALPQTACLVLPGPMPVPETDGGRAWFTAFDDEWEPILPVPGEQRRIKSLATTLQLLTQLLDNLGGAGLWPRKSVSVFGFSQGGTAALHLHCLMTGTNRLAGCVSIGGSLLEEQLGLLQQGAPRPPTEGPGPVLITHGDRDDITPRAAVENTITYLRQHQACSSAALVVVPGKGHAMMGPIQQEVQAVMEFWSKTLRAAAPVEGSVELHTC